MSDMQAEVLETKNGFHVHGYERIDYGFQFCDDVFNVKNTNLADLYKPWGRAL